MQGLVFIGRLLLATVLLILLGRSLDFEKIGALFRGIEISWLILTTALLFVVRLAMALRWQLLLASEGIEPSLVTLLRTISVGMFIGSFLPGSIGTDVVRGYELAKRHGQHGGIVVSLFIDRVLGICAMVLVALSAAIFSALTGRGTNFLVPILVLLMVVLLGGGVMLGVAGRLHTIRLFQNTCFSSLWTKMLSLAARLADVRKLRGVFFRILGLSTLVVLIRCAIFYSIYRAFGLALPFMLFMLFIPLLFLVVMMPISLGGLGVREATLVNFFGSVGVAAEVSTSSGIMFHFLQLVTSLPGLFLWLAYRQSAPRTPTPGPGYARTDNGREPATALASAAVGSQATDTVESYAAYQGSYSDELARQHTARHTSVVSPPATALSLATPECPIFIFGCPRSGTSLLSRILDAHPNIAIPFESHLYENVYPIARRYGDLSNPGTRQRLVADILRMEDLKEWRPLPSLEQTLAGICRDDFHGVFEGLVRTWALSQGKSRWGEKTPQHTFYWRDILEGFPTAQVIHIVRDGRDVALSYKDAFFGPKHTYQIALRWIKYLKAAEEAQAVLGAGQFFQVRYEDLLRQPWQVAESLCAFLGEEFTPEMLAFHHADTPYRTDRRNAENLSRPILSENVGKWQQQMTARNLRIFEAVAGAFLERYGYVRALPNPHLSFLEVLSFRYLEHPPLKALAMLRNHKSQKIFLQRLRIYMRLRWGC